MCPAIASKLIGQESARNDSVEQPSAEREVSYMDLCTRRLGKQSHALAHSRIYDYTSSKLLDHASSWHLDPLAASSSERIFTMADCGFAKKKKIAPKLAQKRQAAGLPEAALWDYTLSSKEKDLPGSQRELRFKRVF